MEQADIDNALSQESSVNLIEKRDEFATKILISLINREDNIDSKKLEELINTAYQGATMMLNRRKKP